MVISKIVLWLLLVGAVMHFRRRASGSPALGESAGVSAAALAIVVAMYKPF